MKKNKGIDKQSRVFIKYLLYSDLIRDCINKELDELNIKLSVKQTIEVYDAVLELDNFNLSKIRQIIIDSSYEKRQ